MTEHDVDIDPPCPTCGGRMHSGCTCPRTSVHGGAGTGTVGTVVHELGRRARMTRAELRHDGDGKDEP